MIEVYLPNGGIEIRGSRKKAALLILGCAGFVGVGWVLTTSTGTPTRPAEWHHLVGWMTIALFTTFGLIGLGMLVRPRKLIIGRNGFLLKTPFRTKSYIFSEIDDIWVRYYRGSGSVVWSNKQDKGSLSRAFWGFDGSLPGGWETSAEELAAELRTAMARHSL